MCEFERETSKIYCLFVTLPLSSTKGIIALAADLYVDLSIMTFRAPYAAVIVTGCQFVVKVGRNLGPRTLSRRLNLHILSSVCSSVDCMYVAVALHIGKR